MSSRAFFALQIVFDNTVSVSTNCPKTSVYAAPFTNWTWKVVWTNTDLSTVTEFSAKIGGERAGNKWRTALPCNIRTNDNGEVRVRFNYGVEPLVSFLMLFKQDGADVCGKITQAVYAYTSKKDPYYDFDGTDGWGNDLKVIDTESSATTLTGSITDIGCEWSTPSIWSESLAADGFATTIYQTLLKNAALDEVAFASANIAGSQAGSKNLSAAFVNVATNLDGAIDWQCQYSMNMGSDGTKLVGIALRNERDGANIRYRARRSGYGWDKPLGTSIDELSEQPITNTVAGTGISLHDIVLTRTRKVLLPITVGSFDGGDRPIRLNNVELRVAASAASPAVFDGLVLGTGAVAVNGFAKIGSGADFVTPLSLGSQAALQFMIENGILPSLSVASFSAEDGATITLGASTDPGFDEPAAWTLVPAAAVATVGQLNVALEGILEKRYRVRLSTDANGNIVLTLTPKGGLTLMLR